MGVNYVGEKGSVAFFKQRKANILQLNRERYKSTDDQVKIEPDEYQAIIDKKNGKDSKFSLPEIKNT